MKGILWTPILVKPSHILLRGILGESIEGLIHIRGQKEEPLVLKLASISNPDKIAVELQETDKPRGYKLKVKNILNKERDYVGQIRLKTNYTEKPEVRIKISGSIKALLQIKPRSLALRQVSKEHLDQLNRPDPFMSRPVIVTLNKGNDLRINKTAFDNDLYKVTVSEIQPGQRFQLLVEPILERLTVGKNNDRLWINTNQKDNNLFPVPISLQVVQKPSHNPMNTPNPPKSIFPKGSLTDDLNMR